VQAAEFVLDQVEVLDQQVALARRGAEQRLHLVESGGIDLPAFGKIAALAPP